jgi:RNA polymerase sigma-70 factor (ECF subfamily)
MTAGHDEQLLIEQAAHGNKEAFGDLYEAYLHEIYRYIYFRVNHAQDAEDLTEATFLKAWQSIARCVEEGASFRRWVFRIAHNTVVDFYRMRKETAVLDGELVVVDETADLESNYQQAELAQVLAAGVAGLKPAYQQVLTLRFVNGLDVETAAQIMERSPGAVRVLQHRALQALLAQMQ